MKKLARRCVILACLTVWAAGAAAGELNQVGVYADEAMTAATTLADPGDLLTVYVVLDAPFNPHHAAGAGEDVATVGCFAFTLDLSTNLELVAKAGEQKRPDCNGVCTGYRICYSAQLPVGGDRHITLISFVLRYLGNGPAEIRLRPHERQPIAGEMDYWYRDADQTGWVLPMYPVTGSFDLPVFVVNGQQVPTAKYGWGALKALYR